MISLRSVGRNNESHDLSRRRALDAHDPLLSIIGRLNPRSLDRNLHAILVHALDVVPNLERGILDGREREAVLERSRVPCDGPGVGEGLGLEDDGGRGGVLGKEGVGCVTNWGGRGLGTGRRREGRTYSRSRCRELVQCTEASR